MIAKIHPGNNFGGLVNYANDIEKKDAVVVASDGVSLASNAAITASFKVQAKTHSGVKDFVGHISLSFSPEDKDKVDNELMAKIAQEYMRRMGIINTQYVILGIRTSHTLTFTSSITESIMMVISSRVTAAFPGRQPSPRL